MDDNFLLGLVDKRLAKRLIIDDLKIRRDEKQTYSFGELERIFNGYGIGHPFTTIIIGEMVEKDKTIKEENGSYELV
ncbi:MAG: hypothetical protein GTN36_01150 [Candidatus Aenigmarchaeota archaeon]|nr:hypothetical protein [Candidatus Aenigmarchaeota archaeon]